MQTFDRSATLAQIVTDHPAAARVFQKHGMDYCCHGDVTVAQACERSPADPAAVLADLEQAIAAGRGVAPEDDPRALSTFALVARIVDRHHAYARHALTHVAPILGKVVRVHGPREASLHELQEAFDRLSAVFLPHLDEEEKVLFPALLAPERDRRLVESELDRMETDHLAVGDLLARIRGLAHGFTTPDWGCATYRVLMAELEALEADTLRHVHLENHVLAPRASSEA